MGERLQAKGPASQQVLDAVSETLGDDAPMCLLALSGGLDSVCLLHALSQRLNHSHIKAVYIDHQLQAASSQWRDFCQRLCEQWGIEFQSMTVAVSSKQASVENAARQARYRALNQALRQWRHQQIHTSHAGSKLEPSYWLLTAHHQTDQAETLLMRWGRGTGLKGLTGMAKFSVLSHTPKLCLVRPLLNLSRTQLNAYASEQGLNWVEDASNQDAAFTRNRVRHQVLPVMRSIWPAFEQTTAQTALWLEEAHALLEHYAQLDLAKCPYAGFYLDLRPWFAHVQATAQNGVSIFLKQARLKQLLQTWAQQFHNQGLNQRQLAWCQAHLLGSDSHQSPHGQPQWLLSQRHGFRCLRIDRQRLYWLTQPDAAFCSYACWFEPAAYQFEHAFLAQATTALCKRAPQAKIISLFSGYLDHRKDAKAIRRWFKRQQIPPWQRQIWPLYAWPTSTAQADRGDQWRLLGYDPLEGASDGSERAHWG